jgi:hypothetical protein
MIGITARSLLLAVFWLGASCPLAASQLSAAKRVTAQQFGYDHTWRGPGTQGRPDQLFSRGLGSRSGFSEQAYSGRCYHCLGFCNYPGDPTRGPIRPRRLQRRRHRGHSYAGAGSLIHSVSSRRSSSSASAAIIDGIGPLRSRAARWWPIGRAWPGRVGRRGRDRRTSRGPALTSSSCSGPSANHERPRAVSTQPAAAKTLAGLLDKLRSASAGGRRGNLSLVRTMTEKGGA